MLLLIVDNNPTVRRLIARIVIVSRHSDEPFRLAALEAGAGGYMHKQNLVDLRRLLEVPP